MASFLDDLLANSQNSTPANLPDYSKQGMSTYDPLFQVRTPTPTILNDMLSENQEDKDYQKEAEKEPKLFGSKDEDKESGNVPAVDMDKVLAATQIMPPTADKTMGMAESLPQRSGDDMDEDSDVSPASDASAQSPVLSLDNTTKARAMPAGITSDQIKDAMNRSNLNAGAMMLGKGAERIGAALNRQKNDPNYLNEMSPLINKPVEDLMNQQKLQEMQTQNIAQQRVLALNQDKDDPNSQSSMIYRDILQKTFPDVLKGVDASKLSASQMEQVFPPLKAFAERQIEATTRAQMMSQKNQDKKEKDLDAANTKFVQAVQQVRGDKALNNQKDTIRRVDNAFQIINNPMWKGDLNKIPAPMAAIVAKDIDSIVSGGTSSEAGFKEISSPTGLSSLSKGLAYIGNNPTGAQLGAFIKQQQNVLLDLKTNAQNAIKNRYDYIDKTLGTHIRPEDREASRNAFNQDYLGQSSPGGYTDAQQKAIAAFMQANKITDQNQAIAILKQAGKL